MFRRKNILFGFLCCLAIICCLLTGIIIGYNPQAHFLRNEQFYIAHGGGEIDGHQKTNSKEAVLHSINHNIKYIELDLGLTSDGFLVALHNWKDFKIITECVDVDTMPLSKKDFINLRIFGKFTPLTIDDIKEILKNNLQINVVTDKISNPTIINNNFKDFKDRIIVECFSDNDYFELSQLGYQCFRSRIAEPKTLFFIKYSLLGNKSKKYVTSIESFDKRNKNILFAPPKVEMALFSCKDKKSADSIFALYPNIKYVYIDKVE